jgi:GT2 family glycosyltransferase
VYSSDKVKNAIELLTQNNVIGKKVVAFTGGYFIDSAGVKIKNFPVYFVEKKLYSGVEIADIMTKKGTLNGCCMLIPKVSFDEVGGFDESLRYSQDSLMWYRIFLSGYSLISDNKLDVMYRLHRNQASQLRRDLYEHDSLVIAKLLSEPLAKADEDYRLLFQYIKRLSKYQCNDAINYMCNYAIENNCWGLKNRVKLGAYRFFGFFRYKIVFWGKKVLIWFRK